MFFLPQAEMQKLTDGVRDVILYSSQTDKSRTRGYAFVEYESHRAAALARRKLVPQKFYLGGQGKIAASLLINFAIWVKFSPWILLHLSN